MNKILTILLVATLLAGCSKKNKPPKVTDQADVPVEEGVDVAANDPQALFLADNAESPDIIVRPSGLQIRIIKRGSGAIPTLQSQVTTNYHGTLIDGTVFDSTRDTGQPFTFPVNAVIDGWQEGLLLMQEGAIYQMFIPADLGYGDAGAGATIPPGATLVFEVELLAVELPLDPEAGKK